MPKYIDIVVGFFESGKTSLINSMLEREIDIEEEKVLLLSCEEGFEQYKFRNSMDFKFIEEENFESDYIKKTIEASKADYVIIEYNGFWEIGKLLKMNLPRGFEIRKIINTIDYMTFDNYINNMEGVFLDKILNSDYTVISKFNEDYDNLSLIKNKIKSINKSTKIYLQSEFDESGKNLIVNNALTLSDEQILKFFLGFLLANMLVIGCQFFFNDFYNNSFQKILAIFLSLLIQIFPFLIIGSIISSLIQAFVPKERFNRMFEKTSIKSLLMAVVAGIFFPVCDCAMVPIASSIVKKGYSIPVAITFLLAAPAVNPIVLLSTYYAFPNQIMMMVYRAVFGIIIALLVGICLIFVEKNRSGIIKDYINKYSISDNGINFIGFSNLSKIESIAIHTKNELYKIGFYVIIGAFISSCIQVLLPRRFFIELNRINYLSVLSMIFAGFFISVCSNSNAFIARSFYNFMPTNAILAFLVMGPMLDITNLAVMLGTFKKKFIIKLVLMLVLLAFAIFSLLGRGGLNV